MSKPWNWVLDPKENIHSVRKLAQSFNRSSYGLIKLIIIKQALPAKQWMRCNFKLSLTPSFSFSFSFKLSPLSRSCTRSHTNKLLHKLRTHPQEPSLRKPLIDFSEENEVWLPCTFFKILSSRAPVGAKNHILIKSFYSKYSVSK